jgi:hypothetical protein
VLVSAVIAALAVAALVAARPALRRNRRLDEVDRFHVARSLTTSWSANPTPPVHVPAEGEEPEDDRVRPSRRDGRRS